jgi:hypothetical protein
MIKRQNPILLMIVLVLLSCIQVQGAISLRFGMASPLGEYKDLAKTGWAAQVVAEVRSLPISVANVVVAFDVAHFSQKQFDFLNGSEARSQKSQINLTGGGIGLRVAPSKMIVKPFAEILARVSSIQQDFRDNANKASIESRTKVGYEINAGLRYAFAPGFDMEFGGGYFGFSKTRFKHKDTTIEIAPTGWQAFVGVALTLGL